MVLVTYGPNRNVWGPFERIPSSEVNYICRADDGKYYGCFILCGDWFTYIDGVAFIQLLVFFGRGGAYFLSPGLKAQGSGPRVQLPGPRPQASEPRANIENKTLKSVVLYV